jgi:MFS family permease
MAVIRSLEFSKRFRPLSNSDFRRLIISRFTTKMGYWVTFIALFSIFVFESNIGVLQIGILGIVEIAPNIVAGPILGVFTDRFNRRSLLILAETISGVAVLLLVVFQSIIIAYILLFFLGLMTALATPAQKALISQIISEEDTLSQANALFSGVGSFAQITGPALGGVLVIIIQPRLLFIIDSATYFVSAILLYSMSTYTINRDSSTTALNDFREGISYIASSKLLIFAIVSGILVFAVLGTFDSMLPLFVREVLNRPSSAFGFLVGAIATGSILSGIVIGGTDNILSAQTGAIIAGMSDGLSMLGFGLSSSLIVAGGFAFCIGFCTTGALAYLTTLIQQTAKDGYTGRVFGVFTGLARSGQIAAIIIASVIISEVGVGTTFSYAGISLFFIMAAAFIYQIVERKPNEVSSD